ncbi:hypothetical protein [Neolewinella agarilytica]|uniref:Uncharacterized protein n=1 Tax=Neolewinella agarilytica TaxID=478744 RepID=A0A1H8ZKE5_9BACT|nr:hypothetical protein [Neolewinella agarilytica]SEP64834.1 hypothetical protein SAMN05444359_101356 [Neolewinella agarilytica]
MHTLLRFLPFTVLFLCYSCNTTPATSTEPEAVETESNTLQLEPVSLDLDGGNNPAAPGFNAEGSDKKAIQLADSIVKYHGGRQAWDDTRFLKWNFFGARSLTWDKKDSRVRIDVPKQNMVYLLDYSQDTLSGRVRKLGDEITHPDSLALYLKRANSIFINDAFWLVQQFKLKDAGVTLKFGGDIATDPQAKRPSYILDQTFSGVGDTPDNRYRLYIDKVSYRINTWQFFRNADDEKPAMETPWEGYLPHQGILLSGDRGGRFQLTDISVGGNLRDKVFTEF